MKFLIAGENRDYLVQIYKEVIDILEERCLTPKNNGVILLETEPGLVQGAKILIQPDKQEKAFSDSVSNLLVKELGQRCYLASCSVVN